MSQFKIAKFDDAQSLPRLPKLRPTAEQRAAQNARKLRSYHTNGSPTRNRHYLSEYGISEADYSTLLAKQHGVCAICERPEERKHRGKVSRLAVDHDHTTGKVRGLLCNRCNAAIGFLREDPLVASALVSYLLLYQSKRSEACSETA